MMKLGERGYIGRVKIPEGMLIFVDWWVMKIYYKGRWFFLFYRHEDVEKKLEELIRHIENEEVEKENG